MNKLLSSLGILITRDIKRRIREGRIIPKSKSSGTTLVKSGKLANSISHVVSGEQLIVGTNLKYARIHHEGGIIRPLSAKYLAIPLTPEAATKKPREYQNTFIQKSVIFRDLGNGEIEALYVLKKQVTIPARPYMNITDDTWERMRQMTMEYIEKHIKRGN
jgi:phage gpG-like protein